MKKLTWALLSLMLLLGLGVASAQADEGGGETPTTTLPTPTFKPDNNATVAPGTAISIILPEELDITKYSSVGVMYVENNDDVVLDTTLAGWTAAIMEDMGGGIGDWSTAEDGEGDGEGERVWKTAVVDNDDEEPTFGMWSNPVKVSADATGTVKLRMRLVAATQADIAYSAEFVAEYTIDANAVVKPTAPTFTLNDEGVLSIENGYTDQLHQILYKIDGTDADFEGMTDMSTMGAKMTENGLQEYGGPIAYAAGQTVKAVTLEVIYDVTAGENMPVLVSDIETYHQPLPAPSFANAGEVTQGDQLDITFPAGLNWNAYKDMAIILYVENDNSTALEFDGTLGELQALAMQGSIINPFADGDDDDPVAAPAFKLAVYDNEEGWNPVVALSTVGTVNVRARMAAG
ncbi:MAG: hypothetical protein K2O53_05040, partial [Bacteroidales bacterium]|nr:hypothetical protein [Bacteroidales bacterium]